MIFQGAYDLISWDIRGSGLFTLYASLILSRPSLQHYFHLAPVRLRASIPKMRRMHSSTIPLSGRSTILLPDGSMNRTKMNSFPTRKRALVYSSSLGKGANKVRLGSTCNSSARVRPFVTWHLLGIGSLEKTSRSTIGASPTALWSGLTSSTVSLALISHFPHSLQHVPSVPRGESHLVPLLYAF